MLNISKTIYTGWNMVATGTLPEAELIPCGDSNHEKRKLEQLTLKHIVVKEHNNIPLPGFTLYKSTRHHYGLPETSWLVIDPRGFLISISGSNLEQILHVTGITEGLIQERCVWARNDSETKMTLVPVSANNYAEVIENTALIEAKVVMEDVKIGDTVLLQNKMTGIYMGVLSLYGPLLGYSYDLEHSATTYIRRQVLEVSPGVYYFQSDLKVLKVVQTTPTPLTLGASAAKINTYIESNTAHFSNIANSVRAIHSKTISMVSVHAVRKVPITLEEVTFDEAKILLKTGLYSSDIGILVVEDSNQEQYIIDHSYEYSTSISAERFNVLKVVEYKLNKHKTIETIVLGGKRTGYWGGQSSAPGAHTLDNFKKFYKIVKHIKTLTYI